MYKQMTATSYEDLIPYIQESNLQTIEKVLINGKVIRIYPWLYIKDDKKKIIYEKWHDLIQNDPIDIKQKVGNTFANPYYEGGIYFACIQALYYLGANEWHNLPNVIDRIQSIMSKYIMRNGRTQWENFIFKRIQSGASLKKDPIGRVIYTYSVLQRIDGFYPYGYKLKQFQAAIDTCKNKKQFLVRLNTSFENTKQVRALKMIKEGNND